MDKERTFALTRMWAAATGLVLALWFLAELYLGARTGEMVPMLATAIGGFEAFLYVQDLWFRRRRRVGNPG